MPATAHRHAFGRLGLDAEPDSLSRHHLSLSLSPALASIPIAETNGRLADVASNMVVLGTLHRAATDTMEESSSVNVEIADGSCRYRHR